MGRIIKPSEIQTQVDSEISTLEKDNGLLQEALSETQAFSHLEGLQGDSWNGIKNQVSAHDTVIRGLTCMNDAMMQSGKQLVSLCGEEDLNEERLENQIDGLENMKTSYQDAIDSYNYYLKNEIYEFCLSSYAHGQIATYQNLINNTDEEIRIAKEKLDDIERIDSATKELATEVEQLQEAVLQGIDYLESTWTGNGFTVPAVRNLEWMSTINKAWNGKIVSTENAMLSMLEQYGFTAEQYKLIEKTFLELQQKCGLKLNSEEAIHDIFKVLAPLCINYDAKRFRMTAGTLEVDNAIKILWECGLTDQEILDFQVLINLQHGSTRESMVKAGIDFDSSTYRNLTPDSFRKNSNGVTKDFTHELLQYACFSYNPKELVDSAIKGGINFGNYAKGGIYTKYEISFKGDIDSTRWGWDFSNGNKVDKRKVDWGDFTSDVDAINTYERMKKANSSASILETINDYNYGLSTGKTKRSTEFLSNLGGGHTEDGILELDKILSADTIGSRHIQGEGSEKKVQAGKETFVQWVMEGYLQEKGN